MGLTDANVSFTNDLATPLVVQKTASVAMGSDLPDTQTVAAGQTSKLEYVNTSDISLDQSSFTLAFNGETVKVELGTGLYQTDATWSSTDGKIGGVLAPINFGTDGVDFRFRFFACPGGWVPFFNAYLISNLQKVLQELTAHPITIPLPGLASSSVTLTKLEITSLNCSYASIAGATAGQVDSDTTAAAEGVSGTGKVTATVILNTSLKASGSISLFGGTITSSGDLTLTNVSTLTRMMVDMSQPKLSMALESLASSIGDWSLSSDILAALEKAFPPLGAIIPLLTNGYHLAALFNSDPLNGQILQLVNQLLRGLTGSGTALFTSLVPLADPDFVKSMSVPRPMTAQAPEHAGAEASVVNHTSTNPASR